MTQTPLFSELLSTLESSCQTLPDKPEETPSRALHALWLLAAGQRCVVAEADQKPLPDLADDQIAQLRTLVEKRCSGIPLAHIIGRKDFMGLELLAGPEALIPRKETELLGNKALELLRALVQERGKAQVLDVCTGSGNLAIALARLESNCFVYASDVSADAVALATKNAEFQKVSDRVEFRSGDLFAPFPTEQFAHTFDLVVCNPPYISSAKVEKMAPEIARFEPRAAFDGGPFGFALLSRLINEAPTLLKPASWLCFEVGLGQGPYLAKTLKASPHYAEVQPLSNETNDIRALVAKTK